MKRKKAAAKDNLGLIFITAGLAVWALPFIAVSIYNILGAARPADFLFNNLGITIITISPILVVAGLFLLVEQYAQERRHSGRHRKHPN